MKRAIVLLSGGMDSCVTLSVALHEGYEAFALHVNYGQRTQDRELRAFNEICDHASVDHRLVVDISHLAAIGGSSITDRTMEISRSPLADVGIQQSTGDIPTSYVPFRNANILAIATSWAEVVGATAIFIGAVEEDSSGYPDCRDVFFRAFEQVIKTGTKPGTDIHIHTPLISLRKSDIVTLGADLRAPLELSWSCYARQDVACGECDSCALRLRGFQEAGLTDPIPYASSRD
ncbi:MAG: 7-cyano-7-deazaguanine synthase QueC [Candidatus Kapabacteria bacterium]|nr:7-cyano-7-deazaguanine synthase QueC [Candidatus Kapabacteria bacterium]